MQDLKKNAKNGLNKLEETENAVMGKWATVIGAPEENQENDLYINTLESAEENVQQNVHMTSTNLEGTNETKIEAARIRLEKLKQTLSKREAEIIELLKNNNELENDFGTWSKSQVAQFDTSRVVLLKRILEKLHFIYNEIPEAQQLIDNLLHDSLRKTIEAKESLDKVQQDMINAERVTDGKSTDFTRDQIPEEFLSLEEAQVDLWEAEILLEVLSTIRSGCINDRLNFIIAGSQKIQEPKFGFDLGREKIKHPFAADINISHGQRLKDNLDGRTLGEQNSTSAGWMSSANKLQTLQDELEQLKLENKNLVKNLNTEKTLRKKYCNMVEDLKGKIHVFCRIRPLSKSELTHGSQCIVQSPDEYTVTIKSSHGVKEFQFDQVFDGSTSQEESFRDINRYEPNAENHQHKRHQALLSPPEEKASEASDYVMALLRLAFIWKSCSTDHMTNAYYTVKVCHAY
ncbi:kinesin-like protein 2 isoform X2 [Chiloscyllium plagiosum]|uniref:kinesin-like protein 2 isoform X2 n=1 Tax=Chiloscyllium plagiosum TaxID=36176 RepID=UPI001CB7DC69|nr:kinesin-like protein 2 isoform X2 [Chiloscyllium plagiosum]